VVFGVFAALRYYLVTWLGERVVADLRTAVYRRVVRMDPTFFEVTRTGEVLSRLTADTTLVQSIAGANLSFTLRSLVNLGGALVMLALTSARLMGVIVVLIPLVVAPLVIVGRRVRGLSRTAQDRVADTSSLVDETLNAIQTVQAFTLEDLQGERYRAAVEDSFRAANRRNRQRALLTAAGTMLVFAGITSVLWLGARAVLAHEMTSGELGQFLVYAGIVGAAAAALTEMWGEVQRAAGAMERLAELLVARPAIAAPAVPARLPPRIAGRIDLEAVRFRYPSRPDTAALDGITLQVRPARARPFSCCCVSTTRPRAASASTGWTSAASGRRRCAPESGWCRRRPCCSAPARARTSAMAAPMPAMRRSRPRRAPRRPTSSSARCRRVTTRSWASAARGCPAVSASESPSRAQS
jgi:ATP-binding cassette subfamily B protein